MVEAAAYVGTYHIVDSMCYHSSDNFHSTKTLICFGDKRSICFITIPELVINDFCKVRT